MFQLQCVAVAVCRSCNPTSILIISWYSTTKAQISKNSSICSNLKKILTTLDESLRVIHTHKNTHTYGSFFRLLILTQCRLHMHTLCIKFECASSLVAVRIVCIKLPAVWTACCISGEQLEGGRLAVSPFISERYTRVSISLIFSPKICFAWKLFYLCLFCSKYDDNTSKISQLKVCIPTRYASITVVNMPVLYLFPYNIWDHRPLDPCTYCVCFPTNMITTSPHFPRLWYEIHIFYFYFYFVVGRPLFPTTKSFMSCPILLSLTLTPLSVSTGGTKVPSVLTLRGIRCGESRDDIRWLRMRLV